MARDPRNESIKKHKEWIGFLQPVGLVVSPPALVDADCHVNTDVAEEYQRFLAGTSKKLLVGYAEPPSVVTELKQTLIDVFGWKPTDLVEVDPHATELSVPLPEYGETLRPKYAVVEDAKASPCKWLMLIQELPLGAPFDVAAEGEGRSWKATPEAKFERLLRETGVHTGLLSNGIELRLVYSPRGESPGHVTFPIPIMCETAGRPVFAALLMLLRESRVFGTTGGATLNDLLVASRKYQNTVSTELASQVLAALYELLRGFQAADAHRKGELLTEVLAKDRDQVYAGQLTVLLRLVFLLYAEDRGLMSESEVYVRNYSVTGLFDKLRGDAGRHPDTMNQRYGAWARLLTLFRIVHDGAKSGPFRIPARHGYLFDPDRYPFLEGRKHASLRSPGQRLTPPLVSDGVVYRVLQNLLILDGERLSYRALDVEQIGSVYEAMMGFRVEVATGRSIAVRPKKPHGAPVTINLDALLEEAGDKRGKWFSEKADLKLTPKEASTLKSAKTPEEAVAAFAGKVAKAVTPNIVPAGSMILQPSDERRRSGSHYTPRSLTEPIVRKALEPVLKQLGANPTPAQLLGLKVCDPAMGSGAFLVEVCRQLGELLVKAWHLHACLPRIPPDEDELHHAQRLVAQRCVYGVDKNPMAVDLAKLSLWLTTLAKDHPFTFIDHALRSGDSLVGLTREQIVEFHWKDCPQRVIGQEIVEERIKAATASRMAILDADEFMTRDLKEHKLKLADEALNLVRFTGNLVVAAFFAAERDKQRQQTRDSYLAMLSEYLQSGRPDQKPTKEERAIQEGARPIAPFHWEIEFPEVFDRREAGFDAIVGNPPFMGGTKISATYGDAYLDWLLTIHPESHGNGDLVAHFYRRAFNVLRFDGTFGLIATNTLSQGDTRTTGLRWICCNGGTIYTARRRMRWPGSAAVVVCVVHVAKGSLAGPYLMDWSDKGEGKLVSLITAYLFNRGGHENPHRLQVNLRRAFCGVKVYGQGFLFDDTDTKQIASPIAEMQRLIEKNSRNAERIFPYIGGDELNESPTHIHHRFVVDFGEMEQDEARRWPDLFEVIEEKVRPARMKEKELRARTYWWQFQRSRPELREAIRGMDRVLVCSQTSKYRCFVFLPNQLVFDQKLIIFACERLAFFSVIQSQAHEHWARAFGSTMKDDPVYTPSDCFETFPSPEQFESNTRLEEVGKAYYEFRADLMVSNNEGLTKTYNRFHDPNERSLKIIELRELHVAMDRAVLTAYGPPFADLAVPPCEFLLDYEDEEDEEDETGKRQKKKPWRYRWPDTFRDEVLALLLELNKQRAEAEKKTIAAAPKPKQGGGGRKGKKKPDDDTQSDLFG